jgi:hypothetical protein
MHLLPYFQKRSNNCTDSISILLHFFLGLQQCKQIWFNMKEIYTIIALFFSAAFLVIQSCGDSAHRHELDKLHWLEGKWASDNLSGFYESWEVESMDRITGVGFTMENTDTLMVEHLEIFTSDSGIFYKALVVGQNEDMPVFFKLTYAQDDSLFFTNPSHDFPRFIVYKKIDGDNFKAYVRDGFSETSQGFELLMHKLEN